MGYGINAKIGIAFQNSFGTAGSVSSAHWLEVTDDSVALKKAELTSQAMRGVYDEAPTYEGLNTVEGDISMDATPIDIGVFLRAALGAPTTVTSGAVRTHTFNPASTDFDDKCAMPPFTLFKNLGVGSGDFYADLNGSALELSLANGEFMGAKLSVAGGFPGSASVSASSYFTSTRLTWDVTSLAINGVAIDHASEMTIGIDNAIEPKHTLRTSKYPAYIKRTGPRVINVSGTMRFDTVTERDAFLAQSERGLNLTMTTATAIQSGYLEGMNISIPAFRYLDFPTIANGPTDLEVSFTGKGKYHVGSGHSIRVTLTNTKSTY